MQSLLDQIIFDVSSANYTLDVCVIHMCVWNLECFISFKRFSSYEKVLRAN